MLVLVHSAEIHRDNTYHDILLSMCGKEFNNMKQFQIYSLVIESALQIFHSLRKNYALFGT